MPRNKEVFLKVVDDGVKKRILEFNDKVAGFDLEPDGYTMDRKNREAVVETRRSFLKCAGFSDEQIKKIAKERDYFYPLHTMYGNIMAYLSMGFDNYQFLMSENARSISDGFTMIVNKIDAIKNNGFSDEQTKKVINRYPGILQYNSDVIKNKIDGLRDIGFVNVLKMIENNPKAVDKDLKTVEDKIIKLKDRDFKDPIKFLERNMNSSISRIDSRINMINDLSKKCPLEDNTIDIIESLSSITLSKKEKIEIIILLIEDVSSTDMVTTTSFHKLVFSNLENLLIAYSMRQEDGKLMDLWKLAKEVGRNINNNEEKQGMINFYYKNSDKKIEKKLYKIYKSAYLK